MDNVDKIKKGNLHLGTVTDPDRIISMRVAADNLAPPNGLSRDLIVEAQRHLGRLGFDPGPTDGNYGPRLRRAVEQYQQHEGLQVDGVVSEPVVARMRQQVAALPSIQGNNKLDQSVLKIVSTGTGFFVNQEGYVLTNEHVVKGCSQIQTVMRGSAAQPASVLRFNSKDDLAILETSAMPNAVATFHQGSAPRLGEVIVVFGFPLAQTLASTGNLTTGNITALAGLGDDSRYYQVSAPIQPGNSGGEILDMNADVVGIVESKLNALAVAAANGDIPKNVNFAVKSSIALNFLEAAGISSSYGSGRRLKDVADVAALAQGFTVQVQCLK